MEETPASYLMQFTKNFLCVDAKHKPEAISFARMSAFKRVIA